MALRRKVNRDNLSMLRWQSPVAIVSENYLYMSNASGSYLRPYCCKAGRRKPCYECLYNSLNFASTICIGKI